jgi:TonB family protein
MNLRWILQFPAALALISAAVAADGTADPPPSRYTAARLAKSQPTFDHYFREPLDRDGLVFVRFDLTADGKVENPTVADGGFYDARFSKVALNIARQLRFTPAQLDGKPVSSPGLRVPIRFQMALVGGQPVQGVTQEFRNEANKVQQLIEKKDFSGAHHHAEWMLAEKVRLSFEYAVLQATLADTYARMGNPHSALIASREITKRARMGTEDYQPGGALPNVHLSDYLLTRDLLNHILRLRFGLAASQGFYLDAVQAHADLQALDMVRKDDSSMATFDLLVKALETAPELRGQVRVDDSGDWNHELSLRSFTVQSVRNGSIRAITLDCADNGRKLPYAPDVEWAVPGKWQKCRVHFDADPGTEFEIVEFREPAAAKP